MYQVTFTIWLTVMLNDLEAPAISLTGDDGAEPVMDGGTGNGETCHSHVLIALPLAFTATALTFHIPSGALVFV